LLPRFPGKKIIGNTSSSFVEHRRRRLQQYMNELVAIPSVLELCAAEIDTFTIQQDKKK